MIIVNSYSPNSFGLCPYVTIIAIAAPSLQGIIIFTTSISPSPNAPSLQGDYLQHLSLFLQMLYLRARLSRRRSWLIVVGAGHFHPAVLVPRVGPVSEGGWCLGWREMGWYLHFAIIIMTMRKSFTSCIQTILKVNYLWGRIDFSLTHNIPRVSSTPLDNFQKPWNWN